MKKSKKKKLSKEDKQLLKLLSNYIGVLTEEVYAELREGHEDALAGAKRCNKEIRKVQEHMARLRGEPPPEPEDTCPECGGANIANECPERDDGTLEVTCHDCSHQWEEPPAKK